MLIIKQVLGIALYITIYNSSIAQRKLDSNSPDTENTLAISSTQTDIRPLKVGEKVPEILFQKILGYKDTSAYLSDFKAKLIILDFWSAYCTTCIEEFPKMMKLQDQNSDILILPIGFDLLKQGEISTSLNSKKGTKYELKIPTVVEDVKTSKLKELFPYNGLPHVIWIDEDGTLRAVTSSNAVNQENIDLIKNNSDSKLTSYKLKKDFNFCQEEFLLAINKLKNIQDLKLSFIAPYIDTLKNNKSDALLSILECQTNYWHITAVNQPSLILYRDAYSPFLPDLQKATYWKWIQLESNKSKEILKDWRETNIMTNWELDKFEKTYLFCYEGLFSKKINRKAVFQEVINDLDKRFKLESSIKRVKQKCISVKAKQNGAFKATAGIQEKFKKSQDQSSLTITGLPINMLIEEINNNFDSIIVCNDTQYSGSINISLTGLKKNDLDAYRLALLKYDIDLIVEEREFDILCISNN